MLLEFRVYTKLRPKRYGKRYVILTLTVQFVVASISLYLWRPQIRAYIMSDHRTLAMVIFPRYLRGV